MRELKALSVYFLIMVTVTSIATSAQGVKKPVWAKHVPRNISWNLNVDTWSEVNMKGPSYIPDTNSSIWKKPDTLSVILVAVRPADYNFGYGYSPELFAKKMRSLGLEKCPEWVPVQAFMSFGRQGRTLFFYTGSKKDEFVCVGDNPDSYKVHDLFKKKSNGDPTSVWIFVGREM